MKLLQRIILKKANASFFLLLVCEAQHLNYALCKEEHETKFNISTFIHILKTQYCIWLQQSCLTKKRQMSYSSLLRSMLNKKQDIEDNGWHNEKSCKAQ